MKTIIYRKNRMFVIDKSQLIAAANREDICNALYAALYTEFKGASKNPRYLDRTPKDMLTEINIFANDWLKSRGLS